MEPTEMNQPAPQMEAPKPKASWTGIAAIIVVLALIVVGALYAWGERLAENGDLSPEEEKMLEDLRTQGNSTDPAAIEADLEAQSSEEFDAELDQAFAEMDAAFETQ